MLVTDFDFELPEALIAQHPPAVRGSSRMLRLDRATGSVQDDLFANLPGHLCEGDLLVLNDSRVLPSRLYGTRLGSSTQEGSPRPSGRVEVLLTHQVGPETWTALVRPARKVQVGERLEFREEGRTGGEPLLEAEVLGAGEFGERTLRFAPVAGFHDVLERIGHMPLPPYIHREKNAADTLEDRTRYQTVYSCRPGSAAAPTAGLHFTEEVLDAVRARGVQVETVTLHVGLGTFQPVRAERVEEIRLHEEHYTIPGATAAAVNAALRESRRVIAAGTTTTRTLEHCALEAEARGESGIRAHSGSTSVFLSPGYRFRVVGGLLTNFHLPQSTLLMLVSAFAGRERVLAAYAHAVRERYRFFSYGDCMLLL